MKYLASAGVETTPWRRDSGCETGAVGVADGDGPDPEIVELDETGVRRVIDRPDRRVGLCVAVLALVVCTGFVGRLTGEPRDVEPPNSATVAPAPSESTEPTPSAPFDLISPTERDVVRGAVVRVTGRANGALGTLHVAVNLGDAVLGWANIAVNAPGMVQVDVPVFAPPVRVTVEVRISHSGGASPGLIATRALLLQGRGPVNLWRAEAIGSPGRERLVFDGFAPATIPRLHATVLDGGDRVVAAADVVNGVEEGRPGSAGGYFLGLGSFHAAIGLPPSAHFGRLGLVISWTDPVTGSRGIVSEAIEPYRASAVVAAPLAIAARR